MSNIQHQINALMTGRHVARHPHYGNEACLVVRSTGVGGQRERLNPADLRLVLKGAAVVDFVRIKTVIRCFARSGWKGVLVRKIPGPLAQAWNDGSTADRRCMGRVETSKAVEALHIARRLEKEAL